MGTGDVSGNVSVVGDFVSPKVQSHESKQSAEYLKRRSKDRQASENFLGRKVMLNDSSSDASGVQQGIANCGVNANFTETRIAAVDWRKNGRFSEEADGLKEHERNTGAGLACQKKEYESSVFKSQEQNSTQTKLLQIRERKEDVANEQDINLGHAAIDAVVSENQRTDKGKRKIY